MRRCLIVLTAAVSSALGGDLELLGDTSKIVFFGDEGVEKMSLSASTVSSILTRLSVLESADSIQETKIATATSTNAAQDSRITAVENLNTIQETKIATATSANAAQDSRLSSIETVNSAQDVKLTNLTGDVTMLKSRSTYDASRFKGPSSDGYYWVRVKIDNTCHSDNVMSACTRRNMDSPCGYSSLSSYSTNTAGRYCILTVLGGQAHLNSDGCGAYMTNCDAAVKTWHGTLFDNTCAFCGNWNGYTSSLQVGLSYGHQWQSGSGYDTVCITKNPSTAIL